MVKGGQIVFKHKIDPFFIFTGRKVWNSDVALNIDGITKFLGVLLDNKLNWKKIFDCVSRKLSRGIGMISKAKNI